MKFLTAAADIAQIAGALVLIPAVLRWLLTRHRFSENLFNVWRAGAIQRGRTTAQVYMIDNYGWGSTLVRTLFFVKCQPVKTWENLFLWTIPSGGRSQLDLEVIPRHEEAWFGFSWITPSDKRFTYYLWFPLIEGTPMDDAWRARQFPRLRDRWRWLPLIVGRYPQPVGPGGVVQTVVRHTRNPEKSAARELRVGSLVTAAGGFNDVARRGKF